jgi:uncharacterized protein
MMRNVFADALYWVALAHRRDQWHQAAVAATRSLGETRIMMTEEILVEFLNAFSSGGWLRRAAVAQVRRIRSSKYMEVIPQTPTSFASGFELYARRFDKEYSLTDCISRQTMRERGITEVLTHITILRQRGSLC